MPRNKLFYGDNLEILRKYVRDETVDLCYIDPPFNSKRNYNQIYNNIGQEDRAQAQAFVDTWTWDSHANYCYEQILDNANGVQTRQSIELVRGLERVLGKGSLFAYLVNMDVRIAEIRRVLKLSGSFYLHCDPTASHYLKLLCDALFCGDRGGEYRNEIIWKRTSGRKSVNQYGRVHDVIFLFSKSQSMTWNTPTVPQTRDNIRGHDVIFESGEAFRLSDLTGAGTGPARIFDGKTIAPPVGRHWMYDQGELDKLLKEGRIVFNKKGVPRLKKQLSEIADISVNDTWFDIDPINSAAAERLGYPTQKPETLLERIIKASSNEGDTVLDAFCGCGTTIAVAQRLNRQWVGVDITYQSISLILRRLKQISGATENVELFGIPRDMESVRALVHKKDDRVRKEFEKWAVLTYTENRAVINEKRGADRGIDGVAYAAVGRDAKGGIALSEVIFSVKSGKVGPSVMRDLRGTVERENAAAGILITLEEPTAAMRQEAPQAGQFKGEFKTFDKLQIVTAQEILDGARTTLPMLAETVKKARTDSGRQQGGLFTETCGATRRVGSRE